MARKWLFTIITERLLKLSFQWEDEKQKINRDFNEQVMYTLESAIKAVKEDVSEMAFYNHYRKVIVLF